jgi:hypothetical protein
MANESLSIKKIGFSLVKEGCSLWNREGAEANGVASDCEKEGFVSERDILLCERGRCAWDKVRFLGKKRCSMKG